MNAISLDQQQSSLVLQTRIPVQVFDHAGSVLGQFVPNEMLGSIRNGQMSSGLKPSPPELDRWWDRKTNDREHWIDCWDEWYSQIDEDEDENWPETD